MKEVIVSAGPKAKIVDSPMPEPNADQVLIKVIVSGSNPKDWKRPEALDPHNSGDDIAGIVEKVGENVTEFRKGDRVAAFHEMMAPHGSFAEYAVAWAYTTFHLPKKVSFEEAATIPLAAMTSALGLYQRLGLPEPWHAATVPTPLIVYGGSAAVGAFVIKLAQASNLHPIIAVAGKGKAFVESIISREKGDQIVDYREGDVVSGIKDALKKAGASEVKYAYDAVCEKNSYQNVCQVLAKGGKITLINPRLEYKDIPAHIEWSKTMVGTVHMDIAPDSAEGKAGIKIGDKDFGFLFYRVMARGLQEGWFTPHPHEVVPGGLNGVEEALANLKAGKASAVKYVFRIADTK